MTSPWIFFGPEDAKILLVQPVDSYDQEHLEEEYRLIGRLSGRKDFRLAAFRVQSWNQDLSPWAAPPVFGNEPFGEGASDTLEKILRELPEDAEVFLGGYSLAGFFALWAAYQTDRFLGAAAVSPSVWFPGWMEYAETHDCLARYVYLSLGKKEEKTRNRTMARVGDCIRRQAGMLDTVLEWNEGNHFIDPARRTAKGFAWLLKRASVRTERLEIRPNGSENVESTFAYSGDPETTRLMMHLPHGSEAETLEFLERAAAEWRKQDPEYYEFAVWKDGVHIGAVSLYLYDGIGELGWILNKTWLGKGYAQEAAAGLKRFAEKSLGIHHFRAHCDSENEASRRIMEKLGMHKVSEEGGRRNKLSAEDRMEYMYES